jgi:hypothetical protein
MAIRSGRNIEAVEPSFDEWARMANIPDGPLREGLARMYADYDLYEIRWK